MTIDDTTAFDPRTLITAANACYATARDKALPPPVRAKLTRAADALVAAVDAHHEATAPSPPKIGGYAKDHCLSCGRLWINHTIDCANDLHRPPEVPVWVEVGAAQLRNGTANSEPTGDATKVRKEVTSGVPSREWSNGRTGQGSLEGGIRDA